MFAASGAAIPAGSPVPKRFRSAGHPAFLVPGHDGGDRRAGARDGADDASDGRTPQDGTPEAEEIPEGRQRPPYPRRSLHVRTLAGHSVQCFGDREEADQHRHEPETIHERCRAQRQARRPGEHIEAHQEGDQADQRADDPLQRIPADEVRDDGQPEHSEAEVFGRAEGDGGAGERSQRHHQQQRSQDPAAHGGEERDPERPAGLPPAGHRVAVEGRRERGGAPGNADRNRGDGTAVLRRHVDGDHHQESRSGLQGEGDGKHQRKADRRTEARHRPGEHAEHAATEQRRQVRRLERGREAVHEFGHGRGTPRVTANSRWTEPPKASGTAVRIQGDRSPESHMSPKTNKGSATR